MERWLPQRKLSHFLYLLPCRPKKNCFDENSFHKLVTILLLLFCAPAENCVRQIVHKTCLLAYSVTRFGEILPLWQKFISLWHFLMVYFLFVKMQSLLWQICHIIGKIFSVANDQILKNDLTIWSHCSRTCSCSFINVIFKCTTCLLERRKRKMNILGGRESVGSFPVWSDG